MRRLAVFTIVLLSPVPAWTQGVGSVPVFDAYEFDFGTIREVDGTVSHTFHLLNNSSGQVAISEAVPSCNCISAEFSRNPIQPGKIGDVVVEYSPAGAVGDTYRTIEIIDSYGHSLGTLSMRAKVEPADRSIQERYYYNVAALIYTNKTNIQFGYVYQGTVSHKQVYIANASGKTVLLRTQISGGNALEVNCPQALGPGEESVITLTYSMPDGVFKTFSEEVWLYVDGAKAKTPITASAICLAEISEGGDAPDMQTFPSVARLSSGVFSRRLTGKVEVANKGKSDLRILALEAPEGVKVQVRKMLVKPGETLEIKAETAAVCEEFRVNIFTNDPRRPFKELIYKHNN